MQFLVGKGWKKILLQSPTMMTDDDRQSDHFSVVTEQVLVIRFTCSCISSMLARLVRRYYDSSHCAASSMEQTRRLVSPAKNSSVKFGAYFYTLQPARSAGHR